MTIARCSEDGHNPPKFDIDLYSGYSTGEPTLSFSLPDECWPDTDYDGCGVFIVSLKDLLEETLNNHIGEDGGEGTPKITALLREYADKLDESAKEHRDKLCTKHKKFPCR